MIVLFVLFLRCNYGAKLNRIYSLAMFLTIYYITNSLLNAKPALLLHSWAPVRGLVSESYCANRKVGGVKVGK
jgi:hypothetical protein